MKKLNGYKKIIETSDHPLYYPKVEYYIKVFGTYNRGFCGDYLIITYEYYNNNELCILKSELYLDDYKDFNYIKLNDGYTHETIITNITEEEYNEALKKHLESN